MRMVYVYGDDYAAIEFEKRFRKRKVSDIIPEVFPGDSTYYDGGGFELSLYEFGEIDINFTQFLIDEILDYDMLKHSNFYFEDDVID